MSLLFEKYHLRDNQDDLSAGEFNPRFRSIDSRIHVLELQILDWEEAVRLVSELGLVRINEVLKPALDELAQMLLDVQNLNDQTAEDSATVLNDIANYLTTKTDEFDALTQSVTDEIAAKTAEITQYKNSMKSLIDEALAELPKPWVTLTTDTVLEVGGRYRLDMSEPRTHTLPELPASGQPIQFVLLVGSFEKSKLTLLRNSNKIHKRDKDMTVTDQRRSFQIEHTGDPDFGYFVTGSKVA